MRSHIFCFNYLVYKLVTIKKIEERLYGKFLDGNEKDHNYQILNIFYQPDEMKAYVEVSVSMDTKKALINISEDDYERLVPYFK